MLYTLLLPVAVPESGAQGLKPSDMSGKLEDSQNSQDPEYLVSLCNILDGVLWGEKVQRDRDKEGENSKKVNTIQEWKEEVNLKGKSLCKFLFCLLYIMLAAPQDVFDSFPMWHKHKV